MIHQRAVPSPAVVRALDLVEKGRTQAETVETILGVFGTSVSGKEVLEVGCFDGAACFALAEKGAKRVVGIDKAQGFVPSVNPRPAEIEEQRNWLDSLRREVRAEFQLQNSAGRSDLVVFRDIDICDVAEESTFDLIVSSSTLEHILNYRKAFENMFSALKPGGLSFHGYHPFFCQSGAHFDTLDFPWGHVQLDSEEFRRYVRETRPGEVSISEYRFFSTLNRMTISDMENAAVSAGFEVETVLFSTEEWKKVEPRVLFHGRRNYPSLRLQDLISLSVTVLLRKPRNQGGIDDEL
jgi:2-polyprenyl-3-methyl-5-hydroxy-6-metoxy-1,4-benzoquinol methylase